MVLRRTAWLPALVLLLAGCGDKEANDGGAGAAKGGPTLTTTASAALRKGVQGSPLTDLTAGRLDEYVAILQEAAANTEKSAGQIAMARGWKIMDWSMLNASVSALVSAGSFDALLERTRTKLAGVQEQIQGYEKAAAEAPDKQRGAMGKAAEALRKAQAGWQRMLDQADAMRPGGALIEARMAEIKAALGR